MTTRYSDMMNFSTKYIVFCILILFIVLIIKSVVKKKNSGILTLFIILISVSAIRVNTGSDYYNYYQMYNNSTKYYSSIVDIVKSGFQKGYIVLSYIVKTLFDNEYTIFLICAIIINVIVYYVIVKYSPYPILSSSIYLFMGYFLMSLNILKQSIAMSIMLLAFFYFVRKKYTLFCLLSILATYFHITALVFVIIILLASWIKLKVSLSLLYISVLISALLVPIASMLFNIVASIPIFSKYSIYLENDININDFRFILNVLFFVTVHVLILHWIIKQVQFNNVELSKSENLIIKIMIIGLMISILSLRIFYVNRIAYYCFQFLIVLVPIMVSKISSLESRKYTRKKIHLFLVVYGLIFTILSGENNYYNFSTIFNDQPVSVMEFVNRKAR